MFNEHEKFIFDLDRTVWDTYDVTGRPIWAKQLIEPIRVEGERVVDDVGSYCVLKNGVKDFITFLSLQKKSIGYLSVGALFGTPDDEQPSLKILKLFLIILQISRLIIILFKSLDLVSI